MLIGNIESNSQPDYYSPQAALENQNGLKLSLSFRLENFLIDCLFVLYDMNARGYSLGL